MKKRFITFILMGVFSLLSVSHFQAMPKKNFCAEKIASFKAKGSQEGVKVLTAHCETMKSESKKIKALHQELKALVNAKVFDKNAFLAKSEELMKIKMAHKADLLSKLSQADREVLMKSKKHGCSMDN